jgi:hypothetical protein
MTLCEEIRAGSMTLPAPLYIGSCAKLVEGCLLIATFDTERGQSYDGLAHLDNDYQRHEA